MENIYRTVLQVVSFAGFVTFLIMAASMVKTPSDLGGLAYEENYDKELYDDAVDRAHRAKNVQATIFWLMCAAIVFACLFMWATVS